MYNIISHKFQISKKDREEIKGQKACTIWMTGLSGSGKSTIANSLEFYLNSISVFIFISLEFYLNSINLFLKSKS